MTPTENTTAAFQSGAAFHIRLPRGGASAMLRMPTVAEWAARQRRIKTIQKRLGPGMTETSTEGIEAADFELLKAIQKDDSGEYLADDRDHVDEDEAAELVQQLGRADVETDPQIEGDKLTVELTVIGDVVTRHTLRVPTVKELRAHRKASFAFVDLRRGRTQLKANVEEFCRFYDLLKVATENYEGEVAPMHRMAVVSEMLTYLDELEGEADPKR